MSRSRSLSAGVVKMLSEAAKARSPQQRKPSSTKVKPTPEQMRKAKFVQEAGKTERGQVTSAAYRRQPLFETLAKGKSGIDEEGLRALRFYRDRYEAAAMSLTRCALDAEGRGGGTPLCLPPGLDADYIVKRCDAALGELVATMRAVALEDKSFSEVAIARFGSRKQSWLEQEKERGRTKKGGKMVFVEKIVPKSGRHREFIREEFSEGLARLIAAVRPFVRTG
jgi:hypothetical protein